RARCQCLRRTRSTSAGNTRPAPGTADPASRGKTRGIAPRRKSRNRLAPAPHSAADKRGDPALPPARPDTIAVLVAAVGSVFPLPWVDLTPKHLQEEMVFRHRLLAREKSQPSGRVDNLLLEF